MIRKQIQTPMGITFYLTLMNGVCCIVVYDEYDCTCKIRYFSDFNEAVNFIITVKKDIIT